MTLSEELSWRGFINQTTLKDIAVLDRKKWTFYHGYDASADSLAIGNLAAIMLDKTFIRHGHTPVVLAGGATSLIGDPGGKTTERPLQDAKTIKANVKAVNKQIQQLFGNGIEMVNNLDWFGEMKYLDFLRDIGKHFSMTPLVQRDYIAKRIGEGGGGISYAEFSYTILQGYDFLYLHNHHGVNLQLAGSDQWGNGLSGVDLIRRVSGDDVHVLTMPLILNQATGKKFGKSEEGTIWLDPNLTSPYQFYQFWLNVDDKSVEDYLKLFTALDRASIDKLIDTFSKNRSTRLAQKTLAYEVTKLVHGKTRAEAVERAVAALFGGHDLSSLSSDEHLILKKELKAVKLSPGDRIVTVLVKAGLSSSNAEATRLLAAGGVSIDGKKINGSNADLATADYPPGDKTSIIQVGKNNFVYVERK